MRANVRIVLPTSPSGKPCSDFLMTSRAFLMVGEIGIACGRFPNGSVYEGWRTQFVMTSREVLDAPLLSINIISITNITLPETNSSHLKMDGFQ